jgi:hypothetical protein
LAESLVRVQDYEHIATLQGSRFALRPRDSGGKEAEQWASRLFLV